MRPLLIYISCLMAFSMTPYQLQAQAIDTFPSTSNPGKNSTDSSPLPAKRNWVAPAVKLMSANVLPFSVDYFIRRKSFSFISLESISRNLNPKSWEWDVDAFFMNQFSHPYHGSMYFNAFRSEGYNFWQSMPATLTGSLLWEIAGEQDRPAINDLINTTMGGIAFGEMTHRLGRKLTTNWRMGKRKNAIDILGIAVDPMAGSNLLIKGREKQRNLSIDTTPVQVEFSGGSRQYNRVVGMNKEKTKNEWYSRLMMTYGMPFGTIKKPFSYFTVMLEIGNSDSAFFNIAQIRGALTAWDIRRTAKSHHYNMISMDYDYYRNIAFSYGMQSFRMSVSSRYFILPRVVVQTDLGASVIGLAAVTIDKEHDEKGTGYDYASGGGVAGSGSIMVHEHIGLRTSLLLGWLVTFDGRNSYYRVVNSNSSLRYQWRRIFLSYEWGHFYLKSRYVKESSSIKHNYYKRLGIGYRFTL